MGKLQKYGLWAAMVIVALVLVSAGSAKLMGVPALHKSFATLGLPGLVWLFYWCV